MGAVVVGLLGGPAVAAAGDPHCPVVDDITTRLGDSLIRVEQAVADHNTLRAQLELCASFGATREELTRLGFTPTGRARRFQPVLDAEALRVAKDPVAEAAGYGAQYGRQDGEVKLTFPGPALALEFADADGVSVWVGCNGELGTARLGSATLDGTWSERGFTGFRWERPSLRTENGIPKLELRGPVRTMGERSRAGKIGVSIDGFEVGSSGQPLLTMSLSSDGPPVPELLMGSLTLVGRSEATFELRREDDGQWALATVWLGPEGQLAGLSLHTGETGARRQDRSFYAPALENSAPE